MAGHLDGAVAAARRGPNLGRVKRALGLFLGTLVLLLAAGPASAARPWACNGSRSLCDRPFDRVVLPATHNSMSALSLGWQIPNQPVGIPTQLRDGIRGLLIDTHYGHVQADGTIATDAQKTPQSRVYLCHELCSIGATPLIDVLRSVTAFLRAHPHEVLLFDQEDYVSARDFAREVDRSGLGHYVYRGAPGPRWPTLRTMIARHQQVVMLNEHGSRGVAWDHPAYAGILKETPYTFQTPDLLTNPQNWASSCRRNRGGRGSLFLMNHWSPPVAPKRSTSAQVNARNVLIGRAETCRRLRGEMPTLVAVDMYQSGQLFSAVRALNALVR